MSPEPVTSLLHSLVRELFQTERSATQHPRIEAERNPGTPPADAMERVARHAEQVLAELPQVTRAAGFDPSPAGLLAGSLFSVTRNRFADLLLTRERSYRLTVIGMRHGVDVVRLIRKVATQRGDTEFVAFCDRWLAEREPLVEAAAEASAWFAEHPGEALAPVKHTVAARVAKSAVTAAGRLENVVSAVAPVALIALGLLVAGLTTRRLSA